MTLELLAENAILKEKVELYKKLVEKMQKCVLDNIHATMLTFIDTEEDVMTGKDKFVLTINKAVCENLKKLFEDMSKDPNNTGRKENDNADKTQLFNSKNQQSAEREPLC